MKTYQVHTHRGIMLVKATSYIVEDNHDLVIFDNETAVARFCVWEFIVEEHLLVDTDDI